MKNIVSLINDEYDISYTYNANNIRTKKVVVTDSITLTTNYILEGNNIIKEIRSDGQEIEYYYDINEEVIGFKYNNNKYLYIKNLQNDVIGIVDTNNNVIVKYYYDGYGREIKVEDTSGISLSTINPIRYRSYYIDNETNWCYLNSRYYDREIGRFITQDEVEYLGSSGSVLSYNLYSYCNNNPVNSFDYNGNFAITTLILLGIGVGALIGGTYAGVNSYNNGERGWELVESTAIGALIGGAVGGIVGAGVGYALPYISASATLGSGGLVISASGTAAMSSGLTISGAQVIGASGALAVSSGIMMYSVRTHKRSKEFY